MHEPCLLPIKRDKKANCTRTTTTYARVQWIRADVNFTVNNPYLFQQINAKDR